MSHAQTQLRAAHRGLRLVGFTIDELDRLLIEQTLARWDGYQRKTAAEVGIHPRTLQRKLALYRQQDRVEQRREN